MPAAETIAPFYRFDRPNILGEGPTYRFSDHTLHFNDCLHQPCQIFILELDPETGEAKVPSDLSLADTSVKNYNESKSGLKVVEVSDSVTVQCFRKNHPGSYICLYYQGIAFLDEKTGKLDVLKEIIPKEDRSIRRFNDGGVDPAGRFWAAEIDCKALAMGAGGLPENYGEPLGRLWRYEPDGTLKLMEKGLVCGNGIGWSPDLKTMYLNDSAAQLIFAYDYDNNTGDISNKRIFKDFRGTIHEPDGMVLDVDGNLWIAMFNGYCIMVLDSKGETIQEIKLPARCPACTTWGGKNNNIIYCVSAYNKFPDRPSDDEGGHLFKIETNTTGMPKYEFAG